MEEEAPSRRSVAELAGKFKGSAPQDTETDKPVRRRPPRSLQLDQESAGVPSPLPVKTKRNSALIEKLQASLSLSPSAQLPSPKSPGFGLLFPAFPPASPGSATVPMETTPSMGGPTSPVASCPATEEEGPASFEDPPTVAEGSILLSINKSRARHSIRRRPPSRRHRKSSGGDEVSASNNVDTTTTTTGGGDEKEESGEVFEQKGKTDELTKDKIDAAPTCPEEDQPEGGEETGRPSSEGKEEEEEAQEKTSGENQRDDVSEGATNTESKEEEKSAESLS